jgi:hypothetical protein
MRRLANCSLPQPKGIQHYEDDRCENEGQEIRHQNE